MRHAAARRTESPCRKTLHWARRGSVTQVIELHAVCRWDAGSGRPRGGGRATAPQFCHRGSTCHNERWNERESHERNHIGMPHARHHRRLLRQVCRGVAISGEGWLAFYPSSSPHLAAHLLQLFQHRLWQDEVFFLHVICTTHIEVSRASAGSLKHFSSSPACLHSLAL